LEVAREIQLAMLPKGTHRAGDIEVAASRARQTPSAAISTMSSRFPTADSS
jgi:hypothetical protein